METQSRLGEELPSTLKYLFQELQSQLRGTPHILLNRYYGIDTHTEATSFHVFADSSSQRYGVLLYLRSKLNYYLKVLFVLGKSMLVPTKEKRLRLPKVELQAALIAVKIKEKVLKEANVREVYVFGVTERQF